MAFIIIPGFGTNALTYYYINKPVRIDKLFGLIREKENGYDGSDKANQNFIGRLNSLQ